MPRDIVEAEIVGEYENDMGLSVVLGPPLLLGEATVAECHQEGDQHSSSQLILLNKKMHKMLARKSLGIFMLHVKIGEIGHKGFNYCLVRHDLL